MIVNEQKPITFQNKCNCLIDELDLEAAIIWYARKPVVKNKIIFLHGNYAAVSIHKEKIHVHRLLMMFWSKRILNKNEHVHHLDENKLNNLKANLAIVSAKDHLSKHNKGRKLTSSHKKKIAKANTKRKGMKMKKQIEIPVSELKSHLENGISISDIAKKYNCGRRTVKNRIHEHKHLLEDAT
jgi:uncharacterized protein (DUF433 family)